MKPLITISILACAACFAQDSPTAQPPAAPQAQPSSDVNTKPAKFKGRVYKLSPDIKPPKVISSATPEYSEEARKKHIQGSIWLELIVDEQGVPRDIKVQHGLGHGLDEAAVEAVRKWRFAPATKDGKPIAVRINVELNLKLR